MIDIAMAHVCNKQLIHIQVCRIENKSLDTLIHISFVKQKWPISQTQGVSLTYLPNKAF